MQSKNIGDEKLVKKIVLKPNRVVLKVGPKKYFLAYDSFKQFELYEGYIFTNDEFSKFLNLANFDEYYTYCINLLSKENYTSFIIRKKLTAKGASKEDIERIIERLTKEGLLDDQRYANTFAHDIANLKNIGEFRILFELKKKGIDDSILDSLVFDKDNELVKATALVKRLNEKYSRKPDRKKREKIMTSLLSAGFDEEIAYKAAKSFSPAPKDVILGELRKDYNLVLKHYSKLPKGKDLRTKVYKSLLSKGYEFDDIIKVMKEDSNYEDD